MEELPHQFWRSTGVRLVPRVGQHQEIRSGNLTLPLPARLIDHDLWPGGVEQCPTNQRKVFMVSPIAP